MNYEERYNQALKIIESLYNVVRYQSSTDALFASQTIEKAFPELTESEDERIRKELLEHCINRRDGKQICVDASDYKRWAAWLEKQGEHKKFRDSIQVGDKVTRNEDGELVNLSQLNRVAKKQTEQKSVDKVEPRFKVGDCIRHKDSDECYKIVTVDDNYYYCDNKHAWAIKSQDCFELIEQKSSWSEEDEKMLISALWHVSNSASNGKSTDYQCEVTDWLKSIKPNHWKPSEEQMRVLQIAIRDYGVSYEKGIFESLYNDLKKL